MPNPGDGAPPPSNDTPPETTPPPGTSDGAPPGNDAPNPDDGSNPDGTPRPPPAPRGLRELAIAAFRNGNDIAGYKFLNAYYAVSERAKNELAQKVNWMPGLSRPGLAPRIGIAVQYLEVPLNWRGSPMPIGSTALTSAVDQIQQKEAADQNIGATGRKNKFGMGRTGPTANFSESSKKSDPTSNLSGPQQISYYQGDFGEWFLEALQERMETGDYGRVMQELMQQAGRPIQRMRGNVGGDPNDPNAQPGDGSGDAGINPGDAPPPPPGGGQFPGGGFPGGGGGRGRGRGQFGGGGGQFGGGQFGGGGRGQFGGGNAAGGTAALDAILGGGDNANNPVRRWSNRVASKDNVDMSHVKPVLPCVLWLGKIDKDGREQLDKVAERADIDILALFEMRVRQARSENLTNSTTVLKLFNAKTKKPIGYAPEQIINYDVEKWRQKGVKGTDPVEKEVVKALDALDKTLKPEPLPAGVTAERAKKRITDLVASNPDAPLEVLVEARYYFVKGLLSEQDFAEAKKELIGEDAYERLAAKAREAD
jgi:hypothetical protein